MSCVCHVFRSPPDCQSILCCVTTLGVDPSGLRAWSAQCGTVAGKLAAPVATPCGPSAQATAAAVSAGQTVIGGTAAMMASRVQATGAEALEAAAAYAEPDAEGSQRLAAVAPLSPGG